MVIVWGKNKDCRGGSAAALAPCCTNPIILLHPAPKGTIAPKLLQSGASVCDAAVMDVMFNVSSIEQARSSGDSFVQLSCTVHFTELNKGLTLWARRQSSQFPCHYVVAQFHGSWGWP